MVFIHKNWIKEILLTAINKNLINESSCDDLNKISDRVQIIGMKNINGCCFVKLCDGMNFICGILTAEALEIFRKSFDFDFKDLDKAVINLIRVSIKYQQSEFQLIVNEFKYVGLSDDLIGDQKSIMEEAVIAKLISVNFFEEVNDKMLLNQQFVNQFKKFKDKLMPYVIKIESSYCSIDEDEENGILKTDETFVEELEFCQTCTENNSNLLSKIIENSQMKIKIKQTKEKKHPKMKIVLPKEIFDESKNIIVNEELEMEEPSKKLKIVLKKENN